MGRKATFDLLGLKQRFRAAWLGAVNCKVNHTATRPFTSTSFAAEVLARPSLMLALFTADMLCLHLPSVTAL